MRTNSNTLPINQAHLRPVAADVSPRTLNQEEVSADSRRRLPLAGWRTSRWLAAGAALSLLLVASLAQAANYTVVNNADSGPGSLRAAIEAANASAGADAIRIHGGLQGVIVLTSGQLNISTDMVIRGPGQEKLIVSGNGASRIFRINGAAHVEISHLTIADGLATDVVSGPEEFGNSTGGGGILNIGGSLTLAHVTLANNVCDTLAGFRGEPGKPAQSYGGAIYNRSQASLAATHCTFSENLATAAIGGSTSFQFHGGGAIFNDDRSTAVIEHCLFNGNRTTDAGGAIYNSAGSVMTISHSSFSDNSAYFASGAVESAPFGLSTGAPTTLTIEHCSFTGNRVVGNLFPGGGASGGAIRAVAGVLTVSHSFFSENEARGGDALSGNGGLGRGGAIYMARTVVAGNVLPYHLSISDSEFRDNWAHGGTGSAGRNGGEGRGGALMALGAGTLDISNSRFDGNEASGGTGGAGGNGGIAQGGGIYSDVLGSTAGVVTISHSHITGNRVRGGVGVVGGNALGGGIYNGVLSGAPVPVIMTHSKVTTNEADGGAGQGIGGGIYNLGSFLLDNVSLIHGNKASSSDDDVFGILTPL